jgi:hypothetical protein
MTDLVKDFSNGVKLIEVSAAARFSSTKLINSCWYVVCSGARTVLMCPGDHVRDKLGAIQQEAHDACPES